MKGIILAAIVLSAFSLEAQNASPCPLHWSGTQEKMRDSSLTNQRDILSDLLLVDQLTIQAAGPPYAQDSARELPLSIYGD